MGFRVDRGPSAIRACWHGACAEQAVEGDEAGLAREDAVEPRPQGGLALAGRMLAIGFEIAIEPPDQRAHSALGLTLLIGEGIELVNEVIAITLAQTRLSDGNWLGLLKVLTTSM